MKDWDISSGKSIQINRKTQIFIIFIQNHLPIWKSPGDNVPTSLRKVEVWSCKAKTFFFFIRTEDELKGSQTI